MINHHGLAPLAHKEKQTTIDANRKSIDNLEPTHMPFAPVDGGQCRQCNTANSWPYDCPSVTFGIIFASVSIGTSRVCDRRREKRIMIDDAMIANSCRVSQLLCCFKRGSAITTGSQSACCRTRNYAQRRHRTKPQKRGKFKPATSQPPTWLYTRPRCTSLEAANNRT